MTRYAKVKSISNPIGRCLEGHTTECGDKVPNTKAVREQVPELTDLHRLWCKQKGDAEQKQLKISTAKAEYANMLEDMTEENNAQLAEIAEATVLAEKAIKRHTFVVAARKAKKTKKAAPTAEKKAEMIKAARERLAKLVEVSSDNGGSSDSD